MSRRAIQLIIGLMSFALIGIVVLQFYWIKWSVDLNSTNFDDKVSITLNQVKKMLLNETQVQQSTKKFLSATFDNKKGFLKTDIDPKAKLFSPAYEPWQRKRYMDEISATINFINPDAILEEIEPKTLDQFLKVEFQNQGINLKYNYGVYRYASKSFTVINGNHVVELNDDQPKTSNVESDDTDINYRLVDTKYSVKLFGSNAKNAPGELKVSFPSKTSFFLSSIWKSLIASIIFTGLTLFCFIYTIGVIYRQKKVSEMKNDFINNMTHEFKTPIATINLAADSINSPMVNTSVDKIKRFANIIKQENSRMLSQVEKVLQIATLEKSDFQLKITDVNIHGIINQAAENTQLKIQKKNGVVNKQLNAQNPFIKGDMTHVSNVIYNLLDNAVKYSKDIPEIIISTTNANNGIEINISDTGIGMDKDSLKYIFDKFYRVHTGNLHNVKGFGLGLSYVKAIMNAHKGKVNVTSELDKGSTFTVFFPFQMGD